MNTNPQSKKTFSSNGLYAIVQKELRRFFTDRRMVITTILLPGLMIYLLYSFMGSAISSNLTVSSDYKPQIFAINMPDSIASASSGIGLDFESTSTEDASVIKERIGAKTADLLVVFPEDFDEAVAAIASGVENAGGAAPPEVSLFYNSTRVESSSIYGQMQALLDAYKEAIQPVFSVNAGEESFDLASEEDATGFVFASLLPMLLIIFLYSGCIAVAPESIAGEKERGTIATLLVTPLKRWELALGKVLSLCFIALLSGASSFIGVMLSLPNIIGAEEGLGSGSEGAFGVAGLYSAQEYLMLLAVILSTVVLFVSLISIISAFARSTKEANTMVMPLMVVVFFVGATAMFSTSSVTEPLLYLIPIYNSVQSMIAIFGFTASPLAIVLTVAMNLVCAGLCIVALTRMFESERIVFNK